MTKNRGVNHGGHSKSANQPRLNPTTTSVTPTTNIQQLNNAIHGNIFHVKLLTLFLIRSIVAGYQFKIGYEMPDLAGKFDDIIFKYEDEDGKERCSYLQAKHKLDNSKIIEPDDLIDLPIFNSGSNKNKSGEFNLDKYYRSYCICLLPRVKRLPDLDYVIICTNIGFDESKFGSSNGIELKPFVASGENPIFEEILSFESQSEENNCRTSIGQKFQFEISTGLKQKLKKYSDIVSLADVLIKRISASKGGEVKLNRNSHELFQMYHWALVEEKVIDKATGKFHQNFVDGNKHSLSQNALKLRDIIDKKLKGWHKTEFVFEAHFGKSHPDAIKNLHDSITDNRIKGFLEKLVFVVNTPNEEELNPILKGELGKFYNLIDTDLQSAGFFEKNLNLFMRPNKDPWITPEKGKGILEGIGEDVDSIRVYAISDDCKQSLQKKTFSFNENAIEVMTGHLENFLTSGPDAKIAHIVTAWPAITAVKAISALKTLQEFECDDSYVMVSLEKMKMEGQKERIHDALSKKKTPNNLLVVVCDDETPIQETDYQNIFFDGNGKPYPMKVIVICTSFDNLKQCDRQLVISIKDDYGYGQLHPDSQTDLLSKTVMFQGKSADNNSTVRELIGENNKPNDVIDFPSMKQLNELKEEDVEIPLFNSSTLDSYLYIERLIYPLNDRVDTNKLLDKLSGALKCSKTEMENNVKFLNELDINWSPHLTEERKSKIWAEIKKLLPECLNDSQTEKRTESELADENCKSKVVILSGLPGSGKSTILNSLYGKIKKLNPLCLIVKINFTDYVEALSNWNSSSEAVEFFVRHLPAIEKNPFAQSLIRHRLQTSGGIVLMMDGFDEIDGRLQDNAIHFMKEILNKTKLDRLYVTTRPHLNDKLQNGFFQFNYFYTLKNFSEQDQIDYLCKYWETNIQITSEIESFAKSLVEKVAENLKDKEKTFVGIPLQCKILAECFAQRIEKVLHNGADRLVLQQQLEDLIKDNKFDLPGLYNQLMDTKEQIFHEKQAIKLGNVTNIEALKHLLQPWNKSIKNFHIELALRTIVSDSSKLDSLRPSSSLESEVDKETTKKGLEEGALIFGLTFNNSNQENQLEFIHRTFAEYLVAKYLYKGLLLDDKKANKLLQNNRNLQFFVASILILDQYDGVRTFLDSMLHDIVESKEWSGMIKQKSLPQRFQKISLSFNKEKPFKLLKTAFKGKYSNIFELISDCLDATQNPSVVRSIMKKIFKDVFPSYADESRKIIERFLDSYDEPNQDHMRRVAESLPPHRAHTTTDRYDSKWDKSIPFSYWNQKQTKANVELALDFLLRNANCIKYYNGFLTQCSETLHFFICNEYYDSLIEKYFQFLSETCRDDDCWLTDIFIWAFGLCCQKNKKKNETNSSSNLFDERIRQFWILLQKHERLQVLRCISRGVYWNAPDTFEKYYIIPFNTTATSDNLLLYNSLGLHRLHIAAFKRGSTDIIQRLINNCGKKELVKILMDENFSPLNPFYVAAARGNKDAFHVMLSFLKEEFTAEKLLKDFTYNRPDGFLFRALLDAIRYERIEMFQLILSQVKEFLGQNGLLALLGPRDLNRKMTCVDEVGSKDSVKRLEISEVLTDAFYEKEFMRTIAEIMDNGYEKLNELLFKIDYEEGHVFYKDLRDNMFSIFGDENLLGMIQAEGGFSSWLALIFDNFHLRATVSCFIDESFLNFLRENGLVSEFVQFIISSREADKKQGGKKKQVKMSYWAKWLSSKDFDEDTLKVLDGFLKCVNEELGQERLKELVSHDQYKFIAKVLIKRRREVFKVMLKYLSDKNLILVTEQIFNYLLTTKTIPLAKNYNFKIRRNVIWFLSEYCFESETWDDICRILLLNYCEDGEKRSFWSLFVQSAYYYTKELEDFLKWATERLGKDESTTSQKIKEFLLHDDGSGVVLFKAARGREHEVIRTLLKYLNESDRNEVGQQLLNECFKSFPQSLIHVISCLSFLLCDFKIDVHDVIFTITANPEYVYYEAHGRSIWSKFFFEYFYYFDLEKLEVFLNWVTQQVGKGKEIKELVLHDDGTGVVIFKAAKKERSNVVEVLLKYLNEEDRNEIEQRLKNKDRVKD